MKTSSYVHLHNVDFSNLTLLTHNSDFSVQFHVNLDFQLSMLCHHWKCYCKWRGDRFTLSRVQSEFSKSLDLFWCLCGNRL